MRFTLAAFAAAAMTMACVSSASADNTGLEQVYNEAGKLITFVEGKGDFDFDDNNKPVSRRSPKHTHARRGHHHSTHAQSGPDSGSKLMGEIMITWYASHDLKNPQCGGGAQNWSPTSNSHIGAVMQGWKGGPECGEFVQICNDKMSGNPCIRVRIVDKCAGCKQNHVDLTQSAFKQLAQDHSLNQGEVHGLKMYKSNKPEQWNFSLFGPLKLKV